MKRILLGTVALLLFGAASNSAVAADMPVKAPPMAPVMFSWSGCYLGGHVGYGWGRKNVTDPYTDWMSPDASFSVDTDGFLGGGQVGCNYQMGSNWVVGIEGDISASDISGSSLIFNTGQLNTITSLDASAKTNWIATATARLGYAWGPTMLYVKGGAAWAHDKYSGTVDLFGTLYSMSTSETRTGWTVGGGLEHAFSRNWSAKVEYNYMDFGTERLGFDTGIIGTVYADIEQQVHVVKLGINYRF